MKKTLKIILFSILLFIITDNSIYSQGKYIEPKDFHPDMILDSSNIVLLYLGSKTLQDAYDSFYELVEKFPGRSIMITGILTIMENRCGYEKGIYFYLKCDCVCRKHPLNKLK
jgi:hypothetical protein